MACEGDPPLDTAPTGCNFVPLFGNVINFPIRLDPIR